jgi:hypothetical protein
MKVLDYRAFGEALILQAVTPERTVAAVTRIAGTAVDLGPISAGPGGRATVAAHGHIGGPVADEAGSDPLVYAVHLPIEVDLEVKIGRVQRYAASGAIDMRLTVRTVDPLAIVIDVDPVRPEHVTFVVEPEDLTARLLGRAGHIDGELRRRTAAYVNEQVSAPAAARFRNVDLLPIIQKVWIGL